MGSDASRRALVIVTLVVLVPRAGLGQQVEPATTLPAIPPILDPQYRHRKTHQLEGVTFGGTYLGASVKKSWIAGARLLFHLNNMFAVGGAMPWLALRIDVNTYLHSVDHPTGASVDGDISLALGLCLLFPPDPSPLER